MMHNVFSGPNSLKDYYNPENHPPLPLVELPQHEFIEDGVHIYAKMLTLLPAANVKSLPALNMLLRAQEAGALSETTPTRIIEYSSGNTVLSLGIVSRIFNFGNVSAYVSNKTSSAKLQMLRFFGLQPVLFGGPPQVQPGDPNGGIQAAMRDGRQPGWLNPGQYSSHSNSEAHMRWTGPQIHQQMPDLTVFACSIGTSGSMTGTGTYLKSVNPKVLNLGVFTAAGDSVPGPRPVDVVSTVDLPWREVIDDEEHVDSVASYKASLEMCRQGLLVGPSTGLVLEGLLRFLRRMKARGQLDTLRNSHGHINCAFLCADQPWLYIPDYFSKLSDDNFPAIGNSELLAVDKYKYGTQWKISIVDAIAALNKHGVPTPPTSESETSDAEEDAERQVRHTAGPIVLDLQDASDHDQWHPVPSVNLSLACREEPNPWSHPPTLVRQWTLLDQALEPGLPVFERVKDRVVYVLSYDGNTAPLATSVLRHKGVEAYAVKGRSEEWHDVATQISSPVLL